MKNTAKVLGIIALVAVVGFSFAACNNDTTNGGGATKFEGTWQHTNTDSGPAIFAFSGNKFTNTWNGGTKQGTFSFDDNIITMNADDGTAWKSMYTFDTDEDGEWVQFSQPTIGWGGWYGWFLKQ